MADPIQVVKWNGSVQAALCEVGGVQTCGWEMRLFSRIRTGDRWGDNEIGRTGGFPGPCVGPDRSADPGG